MESHLKYLLFIIFLLCIASSVYAYIDIDNSKDGNHPQDKKMGIIRATYACCLFLAMIATYYFGTTDREAVSLMSFVGCIVSACFVFLIKH